MSTTIDALLSEDLITMTKEEHMNFQNKVKELILTEGFHDDAKHHDLLHKMWESIDTLIRMAKESGDRQSAMSHFKGVFSAAMNRLFSYVGA